MTSSVQQQPMTPVSPMNTTQPLQQRGGGLFISNASPALVGWELNSMPKNLVIAPIATQIKLLCSGLKGASSKRLISIDEVKQHKTEDSIRTVLKGRVYNITPYMKFHTGGLCCHIETLASAKVDMHANVFIKNLDPEIDNKNLHVSFSTFGKVLSCKVATDLNGHSKGYGYVQFEQEEAAQNAIKGLDGMLMNDIEISVGLFVRKQERHRADGSEKDTNLYVKNFSETLTDEDLKKNFSAYGTITHASVMKDVNSGKSKGFGFVKFEKSADAASAIEKMNGYSHNDKVWYVGLAKSKTERKAELKSKFEQESSGKVDKLQGANLYLKNLDDDFSDEKLKELFSQFGTITSHTIKRDMQGQSMGYGFVAFSTPKDAAKAVNEMNGKMIGRKPLYVAVAQRKEERKARLQALAKKAQRK
ncbi:hypothetical protein IFM89_007679 [Coptis chinensis]|uniref:Uncharacterized protein n=1 Tax=Coptis chinensis TaxID=261450 RepID=A0A835HWH0_9MAGN|nr:hypothetical protein IFM89_007679 [Coptis chinensis]